MAFIPFDATEEEVAQLSIIREGIPLVLAEPLKAWLAGAVSDYHGYGDHELGITMQLELDINLGFTANHGMSAATFAENAFNLGSEKFMRALDYVLFSLGWGSHVDVDRLGGYLELYRSKYTVVVRDGKNRIGYRLPEGLEETVQETISAADATAGRLLSEAWTYAFGLEAKPEEAMDKAVKAVESAATPIVSPKNDVPTLGTAARDIENQGNWTHGLRANAKAPANTTIHHMMQTLWFGQQYRHVDKNATPPTVEQARTHVMLAATLVGWFSSGSVSRTG